MKPKISRVYIILRDDDEKRSDIFNSRNQAIQNLFRQNSILSMNLLSLAHVVPVRKIEEREERENLHGRIRNDAIVRMFSF